MNGCQINERIINMAKVIVEGRGTFEIKNDRLLELLEWLASNQAVAMQEQNTVQEVKDNKYTGRTLLTD